MNNNTGLFAFICLIVLVLALVFFKQSDTVKERDIINNTPNNPIIINPTPTPPVIVNPTPPSPPVIVNPTPPVDYNIEQRRLYSLGHEDGCRGRERNPSFSNSPHYESGYRDGRRHWHPELRFNFNFK
jgi:hypothetical protein